MSEGSHQPRGFKVEPTPRGGFYVVEDAWDGYRTPRGYTYPTREAAELSMTGFVKGSRVRLNSTGLRFQLDWGREGRVGTVLEDGPNQYGFVKFAWDGTRLDVPRPNVEELEFYYLELAP